MMPNDVVHVAAATLEPAGSPFGKVLTALYPRESRGGAAAEVGKSKVNVGVFRTGMG
jgi:hypothetical protein